MKNPSGSAAILLTLFFATSVGIASSNARPQSLYSRPGAVNIEENVDFIARRQT
jgi:hypothetical protein